MTISNTETVAIGTGDGVVVSFPLVANGQVIFFENDAEIKVRTLDGETYSAVLTLNVDYTLTGAGDTNGGNVIMATPPTLGHKVVAERVTPITNALDLTNGGTFDADNIEDALDKGRRIDQELSTKLDRAIVAEPDQSFYALGSNTIRTDATVFADGDLITKSAAAAVTAASETAAAVSAAAASSSETNAGASETAAAASAAAASASETNAATSETNASSSATTAQTARDQAVAASETLAFTYGFDSATTAADPGAGDLRLDDADVSAATEIYISETAGDSAGSIAAYMDTWDDSSSLIKGTIHIKEGTDSANWAIFNVTGAPVDQGGWRTVPVAYVAKGGTFADGDSLLFAFRRNGDAGTGAVDSVYGRSGSVVATAGDYADEQITAAGSATNYTPTDAHVEGHLAGIDTALLARMVTTNPTGSGKLKINATGANVFETIGLTSTSNLHHHKSDAGQFCGFYFYGGTGGALPRWLFAKTNSPESGSDAGGDVELRSYTDAGGGLRTNLKIERDSGDWTITGKVSITEAPTSANDVIRKTDLEDSPHEYSKAQNFDATTLTDAASLAWDVESNQVSKVTLAGNRTLAAPTNMKDGGTYILRVVQDATGSRTLAYNSVFKWPGGVAPVLSTDANAIDILTFISDGTNMYGVAQLGFS